MLAPIFTVHLFPLLEARLIELLKSLDSREWDLPTLAPAWSVRDVAAHLLDTQLRARSRYRGEPLPPAPAIRSNADLVAFINRLNQDGVAAYRQLAVSDLIDRMEESGRDCAAYRERLDPLADAIFPVSWAGDTRSANWFDLARELTERWHHQQQIREATGRPGIMTPQLYRPALDCFMRVLPFAYRDQRRAAGTIARFTVSGDCGGDWYLRREADGWQLAESSSGAPVTEVTIPQEIAWRIFTKGISRESALSQVRVSGDADLGLHVLGAIAIVG